MGNLEGYGLYRSLEPINSLPQPAWKLDNDMSVRSSELLIRVEIININSLSFNQIVDAAEGDENKIREMIQDIVKERGKLHNPVTGTGGMFYGEVEKIGSDYPNHCNIRKGDKIISLASLSLTPLRLDKIIEIDYNSAQLKVEGKAILFETVPLVKTPEDLPLKFLIATLEEAGAPAHTFSITNKEDSVLIMGAAGKTGLLCAFAARKKIGRKGKLYGMVYTEEHKRLLEKHGIFCDILVCDAERTSCAYDSAIEREWPIFDVVVNCINRTGTEMTSLTLTKDQGKIFFPGLASNCMMTALMAEGVGKDVSVMPYRGYRGGHAEFTINLLMKNRSLRTLLSKILKDNRKITNDGRREKDSLAEPEVSKRSPDNYIITSSKMQEVYQAALRVSKFNCTVLLTGESGVGKEVIAHEIHTNSNRNFFPYIKINCASIPEGLLESELFGYEKGAFTGANTNGKAGFFEIAQNGTLFLDEVGELPLQLQGKLLRVLQEQEIYRIGGTKPVKIDVRVITATNKDLESMVRQKLFRSDLFYRLNVFPIHIPPLRERKEDIIPLMQLYVDRYNKEFGVSKKLDSNMLDYFSGYDWPGNIREIQNIVQRLLINTGSNVIALEDLDGGISGGKPSSSARSALDLKEKLAETEHKLLLEAKTRYRTSRKAAEALGISQSAYIKKLQKHGISNNYDYDSVSNP